MHVMTVATFLVCSLYFTPFAGVLKWIMQITMPIMSIYVLYNIYMKSIVVPHTTAEEIYINVVCTMEIKLVQIRFVCRFVSSMYLFRKLLPMTNLFCLLFRGLLKHYNLIFIITFVLEFGFGLHDRIWIKRVI